jgi:glutathione synthase/RimK-type ligase-like ATP-grasp enzyme
VPTCRDSVTFPSGTLISPQNVHPATTADETITVKFVNRGIPILETVVKSLTSVQRTALRIMKLAAEWAGWSGQVYLHQRVDEYRRIWQRVALEQGATFTELAPDLWQLEVGARRVRILNFELEFDNPVTLGLAGRKKLVHGLLGQAGLPVPEHVAFTLETLDDAREFVEQHARGCVIKPSGGYGGKGVTTHVQRRNEVRRAALLASVYDSELLVESMIPGESYRLLVLEGKVVDSVYRRGPRVEGDGVSTIRQLIGLGSSTRGAARTRSLDDDRDCQFMLHAQGLTLESRPEVGRIVVVGSRNPNGRRFAEVRTVYTHPANDLICPSIVRDAEAAAHLVGSEFLGVDVITLDPSVPLRESGGVINEVNTTPALHHHYDASREPYPQAAVLALQALVKRASSSPKRDPAS